MLLKNLFARLSPRLLLNHPQGKITKIRNSNTLSKYQMMSAEAAHTFSGKPLTEILQKLEDFAPLSLAESWDNVGLLVDPMDSSPIKSILLTNDLTEDVLDEAIELKVGLIVTYHPNIFQGLKRINSRTWKERIVIKCIKNNIAVFSPHTSWDSVQNGVNDWLASCFSVTQIAPITPKPENTNVGAGRLFNLSHPLPIKETVAKIKSNIGISHVRLALGRGKTQGDLISSVALCAGSGSSVLRGTPADLYITGEMLHHDILDATQNGISVILCNHSDSERGFLKKFEAKLQNELLQRQVNVYVSEIDHDPLTTV